MKRGHQLLARVPSLSDPTTLYDVTLYGGELFCECQAFFSWKKRGMKCWHLRIYESAERALDRCWNEHGTQDGLICRACLLALLAAMSSRVKEHYVDKDEAKEKVKRARASKRKKPAAKAKPKRCRVVGFPNNVRRVCALDADHEDAYHDDGAGHRWIGHHGGTTP